MSGPPRQLKASARTKSGRDRGYWLLALLVGLCILASISCEPKQSGNTDSFYAESPPPRKQEFRWSNGKLPKSFDPSQATAPPETDIVRSVYEGLTDLDSKTLREVPAAAEKWSASADNLTWTFQLRKDAKWSNGEPLTARDFVRSWKRLAELGDKVPNRNLLDNIVGSRIKPEVPAASPTPSEVNRDTSKPEPASQYAAPKRQQANETPAVETQKSPEAGVVAKPAEKEKFGVEAINDLELRVSLIASDKDFPRLVANPLFRPVYGDGKYFDENPTGVAVITNGPFKITSSDQNGVAIVRSDQYWNRGSVTLESVSFVPAASAEKALDLYKSGDVDTVTNADFEPLALKLLSPYGDFRQATHNALNFYEINTSRPPFSDRRVREALAISIERDRLTEGEMKGSTEAAYHFLPYDTDPANKLSLDLDRARKLLLAAGFPNGEGFPDIHLVVNRNETQLRIARSVARMWKTNLNLNAEIVVKETSEIETVRNSGDFDVIRRGVVFPTLDRAASLAALFPSERKVDEIRQQKSAESEPVPGKPGELRNSGPSDTNELQTHPAASPDDTAYEIATDAALFDFKIIPLYFPVSYGLVKPYVQGFELNGLDAPSLKDVRIDSEWQPESAK